MENAKIIRESLCDLGLEVCGGVNSPYIWVKPQITWILGNSLIYC